MTELRNTWLALLALVALLAVATVSCGPGGGTTPPTDGDIEVHIIADGPGRVIVGSSPHDCRDACRWTGDSGVGTHFEAVPAPGNVFVAWEGACNAFENPCTRTFANGDTMSATFALHTLRLDLTGDGEGPFRIQGAGIDATCDGGCSVGPCEPADVQRTYCLVEVAGLATVGKTWRHPPVAIDDTCRAARNATLSVSAGQGVLANDDDTPDDVLTASLVAGAERGTVTLAPDGGFTYTPEPDFTGPATFTYRARDAFGNVSNTATVTITVRRR